MMDQEWTLKKPDTAGDGSQIADGAVAIVSTGAIVRLRVCERRWNAVPFERLRADVLGFAQTSGCERIVFDLTRTEHWPTGIVGMWHTLQQGGIGVHVVNPPPAIRKAMRLAGLDRRFSLATRRRKP